MTLIVAALLQHAVIQLSDRTVSIRRGLTVSPYDSRANKTIVFQAADARVALGYTGAAYVGDWHTDEWAAYQIAGHPLPSGRRFPGAHVFSFATWPRLDDGLRRLALSLTAAKNGGEFSGADAPGFLVVGWQAGVAGRRKRRVRATVVYEPRTERYVIAHQYPRRDRLEAGIAVIPAGWMIESDFERVSVCFETVNDIRGLEECLAALIRFKALNNPSIGSDCLSVTLDDHRPKTVRVRFIPNPEDATERIISTPVLVWPGAIIYPSRISGASTKQLGDVTIEFDSAPLAEPDTLVLDYPRRRPRPR